MANAKYLTGEESSCWGRPIFVWYLIHVWWSYVLHTISEPKSGHSLFSIHSCPVHIIFATSYVVLRFKFKLNLTPKSRQIFQAKKMSCDDMSCRLKLVRRLHPLQPDALLPFSLHLMISLCIPFVNQIPIEQLIVVIGIVVVWIFPPFQISSLLETSNATHPPGATYRSSLLMALILTKCYKCIILLRNVHCTC